jgi:hypothetical protein
MGKHLSRERVGIGLALVSIAAAGLMALFPMARPPARPYLVALCIAGFVVGAALVFSPRKVERISTPIRSGPVGIRARNVDGLIMEGNVFVGFDNPMDVADSKNVRSDRNISVLVGGAPPPVPSTSVSLLVERNAAIWFVLRLINTGPLAEFRAEIRIVDTNARFHPGGVQSPLWFESARSLTVRILTGGSEWIRIARSDVFALFRHDPHYSESAVFLESNNFHTAAPVAEFEVTILREPPFIDGPHMARFRYAKSEWNYPTLVPVVL